MHLLVLDHSVLAYKSFLRLFTQDYEGETDDEVHEFTRQYVQNIIYLKELHKPDGILWVMDCPRDRVWRHSVVRKFYGPRLHAHPVEWMPGTKDRTADNACRYYTECHNGFKEVWISADGSFKAKQLTKAKYLGWASEFAEGEILECRDMSILKQMLPKVAKMYKGNREGRHWPASAVMSKDKFVEISRKLAYTMAGITGNKVATAEELEADDLAYTACERWHKHDITVVTTDRDWLQLKLHMEREPDSPPSAPVARKCGKFKFFDPNLYDFLDTETDKVRRTMLGKLMRGDDSDNIASARLKGKTGGIGPKKADDIFDAVPLSEMYSWLVEHGDTDTLVRNERLINLKLIPEDLGNRAKEAVENSKVDKVTDTKISDLASAATINLARVDGQKARQKLIIMEKK